MNPLYVSDNAIESCIRECSEEEGVNDERICEFPFGLETPAEKERAAFIVKAVNAHDDLVAALKATDHYLIRGGDPLKLSGIVAAALAKAGAA